MSLIKTRLVKKVNKSVAETAMSDADYIYHTAVPHVIAYYDCVCVVGQSSVTAMTVAFSFYDSVISCASV